MSYDLMVFEKSRAPETQKEFILWYEQQTEWSEDHDYQTIEETSLTLQNWFMEMIRTFPPMNGEFAPDEAQFDEDENLELYITDYSIGHDIIYAAFAWPVAEQAYELARKLAQKYQVGFFDASGNGDIILPDGSKMV